MLLKSPRPMAVVYTDAQSEYRETVPRTEFKRRHKTTDIGVSSGHGSGPAGMELASDRSARETGRRLFHSRGTR
jgi:hypothetical protein